jgi:adenylate kinase family enzyme
MEIILPKKKDSQDEIKIDSRSIVIIGANGSGKTRFSTNIEKKYYEKCHRISAQKSLSMPKNVRPDSKEKAEADFFYGFYNQSIRIDNWLYKNNSRWGENPNTFLLNDYEKLMVLLHTEEYEESVKFKDSYTNGQDIEKPITKLDKVQEVFEYVIPHRKLIKKSGTIETYPTGKDEQKYNASEMSDGERIIFYLIGEVVCTQENSIVIIDEPENHLHKSIIKRLWDRIEQLRPDCTFIYLTHDIDFAVSREKSQKIWMKEYLGNEEWDYDLLNENMPLPEQLYLEVLGSRKPILFIEGDTDSIDYKLYSEIFKEFTVKPLDSCQKVFESTSSFNSLKDFHHIESFGIIDRDRRTDEQIASISRENIWVSKVAEIENFLLLEDVIKIVAKNMRCENIDELVLRVKNNVFKSFENKLEEELTQRVIHIVKDNFEKKLNPKVKTFDIFSTEIQNYWTSQDFNKIYQDLKSEYQNIIDTKDYNRVLEIFNNKGLLYESKVIEECGINTKNNAYLKFVISILKENNDDSQMIKNAINSMIIKS